MIKSLSDPPDAASESEVANSRHQRAVEQSLLGTRDLGDLKGKSVRGGAVTMLGQGLSYALHIGSSFVLARLLSPTDYGLLAMVYTLTGFFGLFRDAGLGVATVQRETLTHEQASTLFWINTAVGAVLAAVVASLGPVLVIFYKEPRLLWVTVASASVFLLHGVAIQHRALLNRAMRFSAITGIDVGSGVVGTVVGIYMAARGYGYWALVGISISSSVVSTATYFFVMPWLPGKPVRGSGIRSMVRYGSTVSLNSMVVYFAYNTEKILLGRFWGAAPLGIYGRAYSLANLPIRQFIGSVGAVAFPLLSRVQSDAERLRRTFLKCHGLVVSLMIPAVIVCSLFADEIIATLLGPKWNGVAPVARLLTPTVLAFALINPLSWFLRATGRVRRSLNIALLIAPVVILGILAGLRHGPTGVATGYSSAMLLLSVPLVVWAKHGTGITTEDFLNTIKNPLLAGAGGAAVGWAFKLAVQSFLPPLALLVLGVALSLAVYAGILLFVLNQKSVYLDLLSQLIPRNRTAPVAN
jgi:O-antigen/teichoic acid export membrane protein